MRVRPVDPVSGRGDKDLAEVTERLERIERLMEDADRIGAAFAAARGEGRAALMPYMMGGFPDDETSAAVAAAYVDAGADLVELGVPFSDPLADGPVIHAAATRALAAGATLDSVLEIGARSPTGCRSSRWSTRTWSSPRRGEFARPRRRGGPRRGDRAGPAPGGGGRGAGRR